MSRKKRANITPEDVGTYYTDGKDIFELMSCESEPTATMLRLGPSPENKTFPISEFTGYIRLRPEKEIPKPKEPRKPRADKGVPRTKSAEHPVPTGKIDIKKIELAVAYDGKPARAAYGELACASKTMKGAILDLFVGLGMVENQKVIDYIKSQPESSEKRILVNALGVG